MESFPATANQGKVDRVLVRQLSLEKLAPASSMEEHHSA
jgi:hypothetical protein